MKADIMVTVHVAFMAFVLLAQLAFMFLWPFGWGWVRNFWLRLAHLTCIGLVVSEATLGVECPLTTWERNLRGGGGGGECRKEGASAVGRAMITVLYDQVNEVKQEHLLRAYISFGVVVLATLILVPPRWPGRSGPKPAPVTLGALLLGTAVTVAVLLVIIKLTVPRVFPPPPPQDEGDAAHVLHSGHVSDP
jgi:hypothetical protein